MKNRETTGMTKAVQDNRVSIKQGRIEIRREGKPVSGQLAGNGSVYLVVDCSGSMGGHKLVRAKLGAMEFAKEAWIKGYAVGLIQFASSAEHLCEPQRQAQLLQHSLELLVADGSTNLSEGIELAAKNLTTKSTPKVMVIITDGKPDSRTNALNAALQAKRAAIDIITIGTEDADQALLRELASRADLAMAVAANQLDQGIASSARMLPSGNQPQRPR